MKRANDEVDMETANKKLNQKEEKLEGKALEVYSVYQHFVKLLIATQAKNTVCYTEWLDRADDPHPVPLYEPEKMHLDMSFSRWNDEEDWKWRQYQAQQMFNRQCLTTIEATRCASIVDDYTAMFLHIYADGNYTYSLFEGKHRFYLDDIEDAWSYEPVCRTLLENEYSSLVNLMPLNLWKLVRDYWCPDLRLKTT